MVATMCVTADVTAVAYGAEDNGFIAKVSPVVVMTGSEYIGSETYDAESLAKEKLYTMADLKAVAAADDEAWDNNQYTYSALNTWDNTSIYKVEGVRVEALFANEGITDLDNTKFQFIAQDGFNVVFDPEYTKLSEKDCTYTGQAFSKVRYYYPNIGKLRDMLKTATVDKLTIAQRNTVEEGGSEVPITIAWAKTDSKGIVDVSKLGDLERWDKGDNDRVQLAVGALEARDYNNPLWNGDTGCLTVVVGKKNYEDLIVINAKGYTRTEFISNDAEIRSYTYQRETGPATKYAQGVMVSKFLKPFDDDDYIAFTCADTNEQVCITKKELIDGNYMLAYAAGNAVEKIEPIFENSKDGNVQGYFTLYGDNVKPYKFINNVEVVDKPVTPANFKAARSAYNGVKLTWSKVEGADGYKVYRYNSSKKAYVLYKTISSGNTVSYSNTGLTTGTKYAYKISSYKKINDKVLESEKSGVKSATPSLSTPTISLKAGSKKVTVKWNKISGATGYKVYRATSKNGKYTCVKTVKSGKTVSYVNKSLKKGKKYYYKVRAYRSVSGKLKYSNYSAVKYTKVK